MDHPQSLRPENSKSVAMATDVTGYPPKPNQLQILLFETYPDNLVKSVHGFRLWVGVPHWKWLWRTDEHTDLHALNNLSSSIVEVSFRKNSMFLGLVILEEKLFKWMRTPQSDAIMSADIKIFEYQTHPIPASMIQLIWKSFLMCGLVLEYT